MKIGTIFDIKEFSIHDGPGARITVFLKGCPLRCLWCHNPEGLSPLPQLMQKKSLCVKCGRCLADCGHEECREFGRCIHACANGALSVTGQKISTRQLADLLVKNADMLELMGGGITVSGGEPLMQPEFVLELAECLGGIHKALQTSGYAQPQIYRQVIGAYDYIMQDIKLADPALHKKYTGVSNEWILQNIQYLKESGKEYVLRVPLIPGITDTTENLQAIAEIAQDSPVQLLRYNPLAGAKYDMLDMTYRLSDAEPENDADGRAAGAVVQTAESAEQVTEQIKQQASEEELLKLFANASWG